MRVAGEIELYSRTVVDPPTVWPGPPGPQSCARADRALRERWRGQPPASQRVASAVSLSAWWMGVVGDSWWLFVTNLRNYGFTDRPPSLPVP